MTEEIPTFPVINFLILFCINLLYYVDRGLIPGSTIEFNEFIAENVGTKKPDAFLGMLQSAFIIGLLTSSVIFSRLAHYCNTFLLVKIGVIIWILSVILSATSFYCHSFLLLLFGRMLSGVGEGSFQCTMPPWIETNAPSGTKARYLSLFYTAIPVGTAIGYTYSAFVTATLDWSFAFWFEIVIMLPLLLCLHYRIPGSRKKKQDERESDDEREREEAFESDVIEDNILGGSHRVGDGYSVEYIPTAIDKALREREKERKEGSETASEISIGAGLGYPPGLLEEAYEVLSHNIFLCILLGYAAQTASIMGLATFGSSLVIGIGYYDSEEAASTAFGAVVSLGGLLGTPLGGYILDRQTKISTRKSENKVMALRSSTSLITLLNIMALFILLFTGIVRERNSFLILVCLGCICIFGSTTGIAITVLECVHERNRAFAMALVTVFQHVLGDVPSPILAGLLKDTLAPGCVGEGASISEDCRHEANSLRLTIIILALWIGWAVLFFGIAYKLSVRKAKKTPGLLVQEREREREIGEGEEEREAFKEPLLKGDM